MVNWVIGSVLKHCKVPNYYDQDCRLKRICGNGKFFELPYTKSFCQNTSDYGSLQNSI